MHALRQACAHTDTNTCVHGAHTHRSSIICPMVPVITDLISDYMHQKQTFQNRSPQPITHKFKLQYLQSG